MADGGVVVARRSPVELTLGAASPNTGTRRTVPASTASAGHAASSASSLTNGTTLVLAPGARRSSNSTQAQLIEVEIARMREEAGPLAPSEMGEEFEPGVVKPPNDVPAKISMSGTILVEDERVNRQPDAASSLVPTDSHVGLEDAQEPDPGAEVRDQGPFSEDALGTRNISWADDHGYSLFQVYYSDKLHYSENALYEDSQNAKGCCIIM